MDALGVLRPDETPHATAYVDRMIDLVADLVARGVAYETADGVYLSVMDVPGYGLLAHQPLDSLRAGARVEADEEKRSPLDFVLWKKAKPGEPTWESPWGPGRPGWHTECVVMSLDLLGDGFDLHGGAIDLIFPHHENERAQAVATGRTFARHWVHNGWVTVGGEKMSKSLGNFTSLADLLARSDARAYRLLVLRSHYRSPIEVTPDTVADAEAGLARLDELARRFDLPDLLAAEPVVDPVSPARAPAPSPAERTGRMGWTPRRWPGSAGPWTTISTRPVPWPPCSIWCAGQRGRRRRRHRGCAADCEDCRLPVRGARASAAMAGRRWRSTRPPPTWYAGGTRPGPQATGRRPTRCAASWKQRAGWSRTAPTGPGYAGVTVDERYVNRRSTGVPAG